MDPMFLKGVEAHQGTGHYADMIRRAREAGRPFSRIWHLLAFKPKVTSALSTFTEAVMRGPSPLPSSTTPSTSARCSTSTTAGSMPTA